MMNHMFILHPYIHSKHLNSRHNNSYNFGKIMATGHCLDGCSGKSLFSTGEFKCLKWDSLHILVIVINSFKDKYAYL